MSKWWKEDPKKVMTFVYWLKKKIPPTGDKWNKAWKEIATQLNKRHKAPSSDFKKIMGESVKEEKSFRARHKHKAEDLLDDKGINYDQLVSHPHGQGYAYKGKLIAYFDQNKKQLVVL